MAQRFSNKVFFQALRTLFACGLLILFVAHGGADSASVSGNRLTALEDLPSKFGPIDRGNALPPITSSNTASATLARASVMAVALAAPTGPEVTGRFTPAFSWPVIPIHMSLLSDGRVMAYGSTEEGLQSGQFNYSVWDPALGTDTDAHLLLANTTGTDIFCSGQIIVPRTGEVILTGGDRTLNGVRNYSTADVTFFDYLTNGLRKSAQGMAQPRWYPTVTTLTDGTVLVLGGRDGPTETSAIGVPELYDPSTGWRSLTTAASDAAYGVANWYYPRAWTAPDGRVFVIAITGRTFLMNPHNGGSITEQSLLLPTSGHWHPAVMYAPGRILSVRDASQVSLVDLNGAVPTGQATAPLSQDRIWSNATVLADGKVLVSGGSGVENVATNVAYHTELWDPATGTWTRGASATRMRLYHSAAMLLPDGRVLTAGGGAPGPVTNLNAEIYEPPYLFKTDGSGDLAPRPSVQGVPLQAAWGASLNVQVQSSTPVSNVVFIKTGSVTHSFDFDQRRIPLAFTQNGSTLNVQLPATAQTAPPGNYLLFVFDGAGVPSVANIIRLAADTDAFPNAITVRAKATLAGGVGALMEVRIDGSIVASTEVRNTVYQDHTFALPEVTPGGARVEVVFTNDGTVSGVSRTLSVQSVTLNRNTVLPTDAGVVFDQGAGVAAFDNIDVVAATVDMATGGALRLSAPGGKATVVNVRARADLAEGIGAIMQLRVNGTLAASMEVRDTVYTDHVFRLPFALVPGTHLDVVFTNDGSATGDRNLYVDSVTLNGSTLRPSDPGVTTDIGTGAASFDGINVIPGQSELYWNAALRFVLPAANTLTVRAKASLAGGVGPIMQVLVDGTLVGATEVKAARYSDFTFALAAPVNPGAKIDVVFDNDAGIGVEDRNLYVKSLLVNGALLLPSDPGVTVDIGSGPAAFDGINVIPGQTDLLWNAALRFVAPNSSTPKITVRAHASLAAGVGPLMQLFVDGIAQGTIEVKSLTSADHVFSLAAPVNPGARIDVVFGNDGATATEDRNLYVESLAVNGALLLPTDPGVTVDIGSGAAAFDGINVLPGQSALLWNAALRFVAPNALAPKVVVRARGSLAGGVGPQMQLFIGGVAVGAVEVKSTTFSDFAFSLPSAIASGTRIDVVFGNDTVIGAEDRNLYIESVTANGVTLLPTSPGVTVDIGSGAAAFDGVMVIAGQTDLLWNAALRLFAP